MRIGPEQLERLRSADAILKGPAGLPEQRNALGVESAVLGGILRPALDTYANVRPAGLGPSHCRPTGETSAVECSRWGFCR